MSRRAEEKALNAYPDDNFVSIEYAEMCRGFYQEGYELAEKDTIERAIKWLKENASNYIVNCTKSYPDAPFEANIGGKCWEDLKKAMEEE